MCGPNANPTGAIGVASAFNFITFICCCIAAGAPWYIWTPIGSGITYTCAMALVLPRGSART